MFLSTVPDKDIAQSIGINVETMEWWKEEHPEFGAAFRPDPRNYGGRPTAFNERNIAIARTLASLGATDIEIAQAFEVNIRTIHRWKLEHPEFREALQLGKDSRREIGAAVRIDEEGMEPILGSVESYEGDEAVVDGSTGEVYQVPIGNLTKSSESVERRAAELRQHLAVAWMRLRAR